VGVKRGRALNRQWRKDVADLAAIT
jgi:hypothetical protein